MLLPSRKANLIERRCYLLVDAIIAIAVNVVSILIGTYIYDRRFK